MIRFDNLHKRFGEREVLRGFTLTIPDGGTTVLLGRSGSGKSVLLKHVVGLMQADAGEVIVDGASVGVVDAERTGRFALARTPRLGRRLTGENLIEGQLVRELIGPFRHDGESYLRPADHK